MGVILFVRREKWSDSKSFAVRQLETFYIFGAGVFLSILIFSVFNDYENRKAESDFIPLSDSVAGVIRENIVNINYDIQNLGRFFKSSANVNREEFSSFVSEMRYSPVKERGWYPLVKKGSTVSYPLLYIETVLDSGRRPGYDLRSTREGRNGIDNSLGTGMTSLLNYEINRNSSSGGKLMTVIFPVFKYNKNPEGLLSLTADIDLVLSYSMSFSKSRNLHLAAEIIDITALDHEESLALYSERGTSAAKGSFFMQAVYPVFIFDRVLGIKIFSTEGYNKTHLSNTGVMGGVSALMLTMAVTLLSGYLGALYSMEDMLLRRTQRTV
jgi:CHASE1-domain containing sensor protein